MNRSTKRLGELPIRSLLVEFSVPAIVGVLVTSLYALIDRIFVGQFIGRDAFAGVGVTFSISMVLMAFGMLIGIGTAARISIALGRHDLEKAERTLGTAFLLACIVPLALTAVGLVTLDPILDLLGASTATKPYAKQFISIILIGSIFQFISFGLNGVLSAGGRPHASMITMILNASINVILLPVFILVLKLGVMGSALATLCAQFAAALWVAANLRSTKSSVRLKAKNIRFDKQIILDIASIGLSPFLMQISGSLVMGVLNHELLHYGGDMAVGAMNAIFGLAMFLIMPVVGLSQGAQPIIGYNFGAKKFTRVIRTLRGAVIAATLYLCCMFAVIQIFPHFCIRLFTSDPEIVRIGTSGIRMYLLMMPIIGFQIISANFFTAVGKAVKSMVMNLLRQIIILIPLLFTLPHFFGMTGIWVSVPISDFLASILTAFFLAGELKHLRKAHKAASEQPISEQQSSLLL